MPTQSRFTRQILLLTCSLLSAVAICSPNTFGYGFSEFYLGDQMGGGHPQGIATGQDGNLWVAQVGKASILRVTPNGEVTEFTDGIGDRAHGIVPSLSDVTAGPDGNIWFSEGYGIGRITPSGEVTEFSEGIDDDLPEVQGVAAGPDGNIWFTEYWGDRIGRINPDTGQIKEFQVAEDASPHADAGPLDITAGPGNDMWFTEEDGHIGRIELSPGPHYGKITEYGLGGLRPHDIAVGSDGNLWFTSYYDHSIGKLTPEGALTEYTEGLSSYSGPMGIVSGPDGKLWFAERARDAIGTIDPASGEITEYSYLAGYLSPDSGPWGITVGPDSNIWFTEYDSSKVGRVQLMNDEPPTSTDTTETTSTDTTSTEATVSTEVSSLTTEGTQSATATPVTEITSTAGTQTVSSSSKRSLLKGWFGYLKRWWQNPKKKIAKAGGRKVGKTIYMKVTPSENATLKSLTVRVNKHTVAKATNVKLTANKTNTIPVKTTKYGRKLLTSKRYGKKRKTKVTATIVATDNTTYSGARSVTLKRPTFLVKNK